MKSVRWITLAVTLLVLVWNTSLLAEAAGPKPGAGIAKNGIILLVAAGLLIALIAKRRSRARNRS